MVVTKYSRLCNENEVEYQYRISCMHDEIGTWADVARVINDELGWNWGEGKYRKDYATFERIMSANASKFGDYKNFIDNIESAKLELKKEQQKLADQRREFNTLARKAARMENLEDCLAHAANQMATYHPLYDWRAHEDVKPVKNAEAVLFLADWHYGMVCDNAFNKYNTTIARERLNKVLDKTEECLSIHNPNKLHIVLMGDMVNGGIHVTSRLASEELVCEQIMHVSELLANCICELSRYVDQIEVHSTWGNHGRTIQKKEESIHADNSERIIKWWLKERLKCVENVSVVDSDFYEFINVNVMGHSIVCTHGDLDNIRTTATVINNMYTKEFGKPIEYFVMGHAHHVEEIDQYGIDSIVVPALCGSDSFANEHRLYSKPGQMLMFFDAGGKDAVYNIRC